MDLLILWIISFTLLGAVLSLLGAAVILITPKSLEAKILPSLVGFAIGTLLGAAFLGLLPHALEHPNIGDAHGLFATVLAGLLGFFLLEKMVLWRHCHNQHCQAHSPALEHAQEVAAGKLILIGDGIHNFVDGVLIAAAFITDIHLGIVTALAVIAHEIPQEMGDFAILLQGGFNRGRAFLYNALSGLTSVAGGVMAYFSLSAMQGVVPYILALAASSFIYIAVADLIPGLHKRVALSDMVQQVILITAGVLTIYLVHSTLH